MQRYSHMLHALRANCIHIACVHCTPGGAGCPLSRRRSVVLDDCGVTCVGEGLEGLCPLLEELHLFRNQLSHWKDVSVCVRERV